jgi:hypothetical protein
MTIDKIKLIENFSANDLIFKGIRKTASGTRLVNIDYEYLLQTPWLRILYDVEYSVCVEAEKIKEILSSIDDKILNYMTEQLNITIEELTEMYRPLLKISKNINCFTIPISSNSVLFDSSKNYYNKAEMKNILKPNDNIRLLIKFKKISFGDHDLKILLELIQLELA